MSKNTINTFSVLGSIISSQQLSFPANPNDSIARWKNGDLDESSATLDDSGNAVFPGTINSRVMSQLVDGPASSTTNGIAVFGDTTGKVLASSTVEIDGSGNITNVNNINGSSADDFVQNNGVSTDNCLAKFDGATGKLIQDTSVILSDTNDVSGLNDVTMSGNLNSRDPDDFVIGPASADANAICLFNGIGGKTIKNSNVLIDDDGNLLINSIRNLQVNSIISRSNTVVNIEDIELGDDRITFLNQLASQPADANSLWINSANGHIYHDAVDLESAGLSVSGANNRLVRMDGTNGIQDSGISVDDSDNISNVQSITLDSNASNPGGTETLWRGTSAGELNYSDKYITYTEGSGKTANYIATWDNDRRLGQMYYVSGSGTLTMNADAGTPSSITVDYWYHKINDIVTLIIDRVTETTAGVNNYQATTNLPSEARPDATVWQVIHVDTGSTPDSDILGNLTISSTGNVRIYREHGGGSTWTGIGTCWNMINTSYKG